MKNMEISCCLQCGGELKIHPRTGIPTCIYCGREYKNSVEGFSYDLQEIVNRRQMREFIQAEELCRELIQKQPENSEVYWQTLLSGLGVVYVQEEGKAKPTFFSYSYDDRELIKDNENYKNAIKYANVDDKAFYEEKAKELDELLKEFFNLVAKENSYDVFISFKKSTEVIEDGEVEVKDTADYKKAEEIYKFLTEKKYKVFFSPVSIGTDTGIVGEKYEPRILKALQTAQAMILVGTKKSYIESQWVQNEWRRYQYFINKGFKKKNSLILAYSENIPQLPLALREIQLASVDMFPSNYLTELQKQLSFIKPNTGRKPKAHNISVSFEEDTSTFANFEIKRKKGVEAFGDIQVSATEQRDFETAKQMQRNHQYTSAMALYANVLRVNPYNYRALWGMFMCKTETEDASYIGDKIWRLKSQNNESPYQEAISCINNAPDGYVRERLCILIETFKNSNIAWRNKKRLFDEVICSYIDESQIELIHNIQFDLILSNLQKGNVAEADGIFQSAKKLFLSNHLDYNIKFQETYAQALLEKQQYDYARKYFEELALAKSLSKYYLSLLKCRTHTQNLQTPITIEDEIVDGKGKKPSELSIANIIERAIVCKDPSRGQTIDALTVSSVYQIEKNKKNAIKFIDVVVAALQSTNLSDTYVKDYLLLCIDKLIRRKKFKDADNYCSLILSLDNNCSKAHWNKLKCRVRAVDDYALSAYGEKVFQYEEFHNARNSATNEEHAYYMRIISREPYKDKNSKEFHESESFKNKKRNSIFKNLILIYPVILYYLCALISPLKTFGLIPFWWGTGVAIGFVVLTLIYIIYNNKVVVKKRRETLNKIGDSIKWREEIRTSYSAYKLITGIVGAVLAVALLLTSFFGAIGTYHTTNEADLYTYLSEPWGRRSTIYYEYDAGHVQIANGDQTESENSSKPYKIKTKDIFFGKLKSNDDSYEMYITAVEDSDFTISCSRIGYYIRGELLLNGEKVSTLSEGECAIHLNKTEVLCIRFGNKNSYTYSLSYGNEVEFQLIFES